MSIIIVGGGMAGMVLAQAISHLTSGQLLVHIVEASTPQINEHTAYDARTIVLTQNTCRQLELIGIWKTISSYATSICSLHISDRGHIGSTIIEAHDYNTDILGQVIKFHDIRLHLFHLLQNSPGIIMHYPVQVINISRNENSINVTLDNNKIISGRLLVAADGSNSEIATQCGIVRQQKSYNQVAITANITTTINHNKRAWERFTEYGPLAVLPMSKNNCSIVWCHDLRNIKEIMFWSNDYFRDKLQEAFGWRLGRIIHIENRAAYPLSLINTIRPISHRVVLVGNAAQTLHPVAGQGFNLGLRDIMSLVKILIQVWNVKGDYGAYSVLKYYQFCRISDKKITIGITDGLINIFTNNWIPLVLGRNLGLIALELFTPIRNILIQRTFGWINPHQRGE